MPGAKVGWSGRRPPGFAGGPNVEASPSESLEPASGLLVRERGALYLFMRGSQRRRPAQPRAPGWSPGREAGPRTATRAWRPAAQARWARTTSAWRRPSGASRSVTPARPTHLPARGAAVRRAAWPGRKPGPESVAHGRGAGAAARGGGLGRGPAGTLQPGSGAARCRRYTESVRGSGGCGPDASVLEGGVGLTML